MRTSHYPQSQYFLDECDRLGLLVFTELPGWQHIGDGAWKDRACAMLQEMLLQNRNHPSIILWGVRINESVDDDEFYTRTNQIAHTLDPSRATSGVRYLEKEPSPGRCLRLQRFLPQRLKRRGQAEKRM